MSSTRMPALFLDYGSPMNMPKDNLYIRSWQRLGMTPPCPQAIVVTSAHWFIRGTGVTAMETPPTIHDLSDFPQALYDMYYPTPGSPALAQHLAELLAPVPATLDKEVWGFDRGSWGMLIKMYPGADIPMVQLNINSSRPAAWYFGMGRKLAVLRDEGTMLVVSDNMVHNLRTVKWHDDNLPYPWTMSFNEYMKVNLTWQETVEQHPLVSYLDHEGGALSNPTPEHYLPSLHVLDAWDGREPITIPVDGIEMGSLSMLSVQIGQQLPDGECHPASLVI